MSSHENSASGGANASTLQSLIDQAPIGSTQIIVLMLCAMITMIEGVDLSVIPLLAPTMTEALSLTQKEFGIVLSALPAGLIIGGALIGWLGDRTGRRSALIFTMFLMTGSTLATALVETVPALLVCRVLTGISFGGVVPVAISLVSEYIPSRIRASMLSLVVLFTAFGQLLASLLVKLSLFSAGPWQNMVYCVAAGCGVVTVLLLLFLPESPGYLLLRNAGSPALAKILSRLRIEEMPSMAAVKDTDGPARNRFGELFLEGRALGTCLLWATFIGVMAVMSFFSNSLPTLYAHVGRSGSSAMAAYSTGSMLGGLLLPLFQRRWGVNQVLMAVIMAGCAVTFGQGLVLPMADGVNLLLAFLCGASVSGAFFILYPPAVNFYPTAIRSTGIGAAVAFGRFGNVVTPAAAGFMLTAGFAPSSVFYAMAAPLIISFIGLGIFHKITKRDESDS